MRKALVALVCSMTLEYDPYELKLAREIAHALNDLDSFPLHLLYVRKYKEEHLRKTLQKVLAVDERKIKRSRAALYTYLISRGDQYGGTGY